MIPPLYIYLILFVLSLPLVALAALGFILPCVRPDRMRPPWWDWGMDEPTVKAKDESEDKSSSD